ncbi:YihY/virulence factor BrkB family protein [Horticoccus luteus]|uniref:YihY/virulence factor BrkB family protein n=1 Tax=Horticoccus luteus TaxID=2862869 RepID=UPI002104612C|nr:YihY/virulence factor BrkB family protein [Horticoccus luteus]
MTINPASAADARGRSAHHPGELPARGWLDILARTRQKLAADNLSIVAAGVAYYGFFAAVPALGATISLYALVADPSTIAAHLELLARVLPGEVMPLVQEQISRITGNTTAAGWGAVIGVVLALYSSARATRALIAGLNIAYNETERRGFLRLLVRSLALTFAAILGVLVVIGLLAAVPLAARRAGVSAGTEMLVACLRWPCLVVLFASGVSALYRFGPSRRPARWSWLSGGAMVAATLWIAACVGFSFYVSKFGSYDRTYGSLGAIVIFLFWLYLTAYVVLLGAELNAEMERQTARDTTPGPERPLGQRGAFAADTVGHGRGEKS